MSSVLLWWEAAGQQVVACWLSVPDTRASETSFVMATNGTGGIVESGGAAC
jgi:hypothetical protein